MRERLGATQFAVRIGVLGASVAPAREWATLAQVPDSIPVFADEQSRLRPLNKGMGSPHVLIINRNSGIDGWVAGNVDIATVQDDRLEAAVRAAMTGKL